MIILLPELSKPSQNSYFETVLSKRRTSEFGVDALNLFESSEGDVAQNEW